MSMQYRRPINALYDHLTAFLNEQGEFVTRQGRQAVIKWLIEAEAKDMIIIRGSALQSGELMIHWAEARCLANQGASLQSDRFQQVSIPNRCPKCHRDFTKKRPWEEEAK